MTESAADMGIVVQPRRSSLIVRLSLWYLALTLINIIVFWVGTGSNQMRLISDKASMFARSTAFEALRRLQPQLDRLALSTRPVAAFQAIAADFSNALRAQNSRGHTVLPSYAVFTTAGETLLFWPKAGAETKREATAEDLIASAKALQLRELKNEPFMAKPDLQKGLITVYLPLTATGDVDLILAGTIHMPELNGEITSLVRLGVAMVFLLVVLQTGMAYLVYQALVKPIRRVSAAALAVATGQFVSVDFKTRKRDEVYQLVSSFNKMSADLKHNRDVMDFELGLAKTIQAAILPQCLEMGSVTANVHYNPLHTVSGDLYDLQTLSDGSVAIFIGDASGHGVPAAFITIMAKIFFSDFVKQNPDPATVLSRMNQALAGYFEGAGLYMTAFYIRIFPDNTAEYCNGMHPEPIVLRSNGEHELIEATAFYVGMMKEVFKDFETGNITLLPGDRLVLYTDGFTEAKNMAEEEYTAERFISLIHSAATQEPANMIRYALADLAEFTAGAKRTDDETLIVCQIGAPVANKQTNPGEPMEKSDEVLLENQHYVQKLTEYLDMLESGQPVKFVWQLAEEKLREKDFVTALAAYDALVRLTGAQPALLFRQALCYYRIRLFADCARALQGCLSAEPDSPDANALFSLLSLKTGDFGKALHYIEKAIGDNHVNNRYRGILKKMSHGLQR